MKHSIPRQAPKPSRWPFPAPPRQPWQPRSPGVGRPGLSRGGMLADICMVVAWGVSIPGVMWLAAASGF